MKKKTKKKAGKRRDDELKSLFSGHSSTIYPIPTLTEKDQRKLMKLAKNLMKELSND